MGRQSIGRRASRSKCLRRVDELVCDASWADKASGARPRDACDCANRASKSDLAHLRKHQDSVREWLYERARDKTRGHTKVSGRSPVWYRDN